MRAQARSFHLLEALEARVLLDALEVDEAFQSGTGGLFVANQGQWADSLDFVYQRPGATIALGKQEVTYSLLGQADGQAALATVRARFDGAYSVAPRGMALQAPTFNFFLGQADRWRSDVSAYEQAVYDDLYDGIDLYMLGAADHVKYEFHLDPGQDWSQIAISLEGVQPLAIGPDGSLLLRTDLGEMVDSPPVIYQEIDGVRRELAGAYRLIDADTYGFDIFDAVDPEAALVIDPALNWSTYLGGTGEERGDAVATDASGNVYVAGITQSPSYFYLSGVDATWDGLWDEGFVTKFSPSGQRVWSTYLGGSGDDNINAIAVNASGVFVTGGTQSNDFPMGGICYDDSFNGATDFFVTKLSLTGNSLIYSTFIGTTGDESGAAIAVDSIGHAYVVGYTNGTAFPTAGSAYDSSFNGVQDAVAFKLNSTGSALGYSTFLGGNNYSRALGVDCDDNGMMYVAGRTEATNFPATAGAMRTTLAGGTDAFAAKINTAATSPATSLVYSTYLGGSNYDDSQAVAIDAAGNAYVAGYTASTNFPTTAGAFDTTFNGGGYFGYDGFVTKLNAAGSAALYSTYLGGAASDDGCSGIDVNAANQAVVTGFTGSNDFPVSATTYDSSYNGGPNWGDAFVTQLNATGNGLVFSTFLGGSGDEAGTDVTYDVLSNIIAVGGTASTGFPITAGAFDTTLGGTQDAYVTKFGGATPPAYQLFVTVATSIDPTAAEEGQRAGSYALTRSAVSDTPLNVYFRMSGSAVNGLDYTLQVNGNRLTGLMATIPANATTVVVSLVPVNDALVELNETATLQVYTATGYTAGTPASGELAIIDNDLPGVSISAIDRFAGEPTNNGTFRITRSAATAAALPVSFTVGGSATRGTDYVLKTGTTVLTTNTVTIPGNLTFVDVTVAVSDDLTVEGKEAVDMTLAAGGGYTLAPTPTASVEIADNDLPTVTVAAIDLAGGEPGTDAAAFRLTRNAGFAGDLNVYFMTSGTAVRGRDYVLKPGSIAAPPLTGYFVTIPDGQSFVNLYVVPLDDTYVEAPETVIGTVYGSQGYVVGAQKQDTVRIFDDDLPTVAIQAANPRASEPTLPGTFRITRSQATSQPLNVNIAVSGSATRNVDYALRVGTTPLNGTVVTIPANATTVSVTVAPIDDALVEGTEWMAIGLPAGTGYTVHATNFIDTVNIADNDKPTVTVAAVDDNASEPGANTGLFRITRDAGLAGDMNVTFLASGTALRGRDYELRSGTADGALVTGSTVTIPDGQASVNLFVVPLDDTAVESAETAIVTVSPGLSYTVGAARQATVTIADDDLPAVSIVAVDPRAGEPADPASFRITRNAVTAAEMTVNFALAGSATRGTDYVLKTGTTVLAGNSVTIPANAPSVIVQVAPIDDLIVEGTEQVQMTLTAGAGYAVGAPANAQANLADNDRPLVYVLGIDPYATEGDDTATFRLYRTAGLTGDLTVNVQLGGTALRNTDYTVAAGGQDVTGGTVVIPAGAASVDVVVTALADANVEAAELVSLRVLGGTDYTPWLVVNTFAWIFNVNPLITVRTVDVASIEASNTGTFRIYSSAAGPARTVNFTLGGQAQLNVDYVLKVGATTLTSNSATIPAGQSYVDVTVQPVEDSLLEGPELVILSLSGGTGYKVDLPDSAALYILDND
ncbi:MAG TPA: Calx-beta domain-containing protein [Phycisphaerae bacterium]|nr:Calx-beta domain-containing protein [Phycisphaerae bacterium]HQL73317.1 Calx-beta domain-containing protein [Phycisphaerae bacterium]